MRHKKNFVFILLLLGIASFSLLAWALFEPQAIDKETQNFLQEFSLVLSLIQENYFEKPDVEKLVYGAIRGMLNTLDPHSSFFDREGFRNMRLSQQGSYYGIGIAISIRNNRLTIVSPVPGSPASSLGLQAGDIIDKIGEESTKGMNINTALLKLRGPKGTEAKITIIREGYKEPLKFTIERAEITIASVSQDFFLQPGTGYIRLARF